MSTRRLILILSIFFGISVFSQSEKIDDRVSQLTKSLSDKNSRIRENAAYALGKTGPQAKNAIPALIKALYDKNGIIRESAAEALRKIDPNWKTKKYPKELQEIVDKYLKK